MKLNKILQLSAVTLALAFCVSIANAKHHEEAEDLLADLEDCKADSATIKKAKVMIKRTAERRLKNKWTILSIHCLTNSSTA